MECDFEELLEKLRTYVRLDQNKVPRFSELVGVELFEKFRLCVVRSVAGNELEIAYKWISETKRALDNALKTLSISSYTLPKELSSFISDPLQHLKKKVFNYSYDLLRGSISFEEFYEKVLRAVTTSLRANLRGCYQLWALTTMMKLFGEMGYVIAYPESRYLNFDRSGKQKLGVIPPNFVLLSIGRGYLSFFHEAPRPLGWEDTGDLQKVWSLYTALRPDLMVYSGRVMDIVDLSSSPPIKRPDAIIEFKELEDWWKRVRDLKGFLRRPLTAEEWRSKWINGLFEGLAEAMGVKRVDVEKRVEEGASMRVKEYQLVLLYKATYKPRKILLVSRKETPPEVKKSLIESGIDVLDRVEFSEERLREAVNQLSEIASFNSSETVVIEVPRSVAIELEAIRMRLKLNSLGEVIGYLVRSLHDSGAKPWFTSSE
jgi:hypothetical protein|uniref:Uncharacterized protein n=1 Tax=Ignisphaera aggregans TaxID=334771 RepID=A0A7J2U3J5_9CREN